MHYENIDCITCRRCNLSFLNRQVGSLISLRERAKDPIIDLTIVIINNIITLSWYSKQRKSKVGGVVIISLSLMTCPSFQHPSWRACLQTQVELYSCSSPHLSVYRSSVHCASRCCRFSSFVWQPWSLRFVLSARPCRFAPRSVSTSKEWMKYAGDTKER